jgi:transposase
MARFDLTDFKWSVFQPLLPTRMRWVPHADDRKVLNGISPSNGCAWADIPAPYGTHTTCVNRFNRWRIAGHWGRILQAVSAAYDGDVKMIDSSSICVHQHAANGPIGRVIPCTGRSRGGLTTKIHALW